MKQISTPLIAALVMCGCNNGTPASSATSRSAAAPSSSASAAAVPASAAPSPGAADSAGVVFGAPSFKPGDKLTTKARVGAGQFVATHHFDTEILAVQDGKATKRRLKFIEARLGDKPLPVEGKAYVIERIGDKFTATSPDGAAVPKDEHNQLAVDDPTSFELPKRPLKPGDVVKTDSVGALTFDKRNGPVGIFTYAMPGAQCQAEVRVKDSRLLSIKCTAPADGGAAAVTTIEHTYH